MATKQWAYWLNPGETGHDQAGRQDTRLLFAVLVLILLGCIMVYSMSYFLPETKKYKNYAEHHFLLQQLKFTAVGLLGLWSALKVPLSFLEKNALSFLLVILLVLAVMLVPGVVPKATNGAARWLTVFGFRFQPSEFLKLAAILYFASYCARKRESIDQFKQGLLPVLIVLGVIGAVVLLQPDIGVFLVISAIAIAVVFYAGGHLGFLTLLICTTGSAVVIMSLKFRAGRLSVMVGEVTNRTTDQIDYAVSALASGRLWGRGLGDGVEKAHWLNEIHTDFILAGIGEELGFLGVMTVLGLLAWIVFRCYSLARQAQGQGQYFAAYTAFGIGTLIALQTLIHTGSNLKLLPPKGLTLPFVSYGGTSQVMLLAAVGVLLRVQYEITQANKAGAMQ